ncbi:type II secretion system protein D [compost metagenome]
MLFRLLKAATVVVLLSSCTTSGEVIRNAEALAEDGDYESAVAALHSQYEKEPSSKIYKGALIRITNASLSALSLKAERALSVGNPEGARSFYTRALLIEPGYPKAKDGLARIKQYFRQKKLIELATQHFDIGNYELAGKHISEILSESPSHPDALRVRKMLDQKRFDKEQQPRLLDVSLKTKISLELRDTPLKDSLALISRSAKINFILDQDTPEDTLVTLFVDNATIEDVLEFLFQTYSLDRKILNRKTILIYPATPEKKARYADLYTRSFRISNIPPLSMAELLKEVVKPADLYVVENSRSLIIRETAETLKAAERLIALHDVVPAELILDVEIMEISTDALSNLGAEYPNRATLSLQGGEKKPGSLTLEEWRNLDSSSFILGVGDPLAVINMKSTLGSANILAKPQIRVKNREQANILIGDKVPVITSTLNQTSGFESQSVTYLDVGIKLDVIPEIFPGNEVSMKIMLEVSNIAKEIIGESGLRAYQIGTRTANTTLQLKDGETQILAGLIRNEELNSESKVPGLGSIPGIGRLFSNENNTHKKSELVLLLTPRIVRNTSYPDSFEREFYTGTKDRFSLQAPSLGDEARYTREPPALDTPVTTEHGKVDTRPLPPGQPSSVQALTSSGAQLSMAVPHSVSAGQEFNVPLALDSGYSHPVSFQLSSSSKSIEILSVSSMLAEEALAHSNDAQHATFKLQKSAIRRSGDILAIARMRALPGEKPETVLLELKPELSDNQVSTSVIGMTQEVQIVIEEKGAEVEPGIAPPAGAPQ